MVGTEDGFGTAAGWGVVRGAVMAVGKAGDQVVAAGGLFGCCLYGIEHVLPRYGVIVNFVDGTDLEQWRTAITADTRAVFFESIPNPALEVINIKAVSDLAHEEGALVVVDNVFATPVFSRAVEHGAD